MIHQSPSTASRRGRAAARPYGWMQNGLAPLIVLLLVALDLALAQLLPKFTVTSNQ